MELAKLDLVVGFHSNATNLLAHFEGDYRGKSQHVQGFSLNTTSKLIILNTKFASPSALCEHVVASKTYDVTISAAQEGTCKKPFSVIRKRTSRGLTLHVIHSHSLTSYQWKNIYGMLLRSISDEYHFRTKTPRIPIHVDYQSAW